MTRTRVAHIFKTGQPETTVDVRGWVRTKRESKQDFAFVELNDGSCMANLQIVIDAKIPDYSSLIKQIQTGASVAVIGTIKQSLGKGQRVEVPVKLRLTNLTEHNGKYYLRTLDITTTDGKDLPEGRANGFEWDVMEFAEMMSRDGF